MKKPLIPLLLFIISCESHNTQVYPDLIKENLRGSVKSMKEMYFEAEPIEEWFQDEDGYPDSKIVGFKKGKIMGTDDYIDFKKLYNKAGIITTHIMYSQGKPSSKVEYVFNKYGQKIDFIDYDFIENKIVNAKKYYFNEFSYKTNQVIQNTTQLSNNELFSTTTYNYNDSGKLTDWITEYKQTSLILKHLLEYDDNDFLIKTIDISKGNIQSIRTFDNDKFGNKIEEMIYDPNSNLLKTIDYSYKYDIMNNWIYRASSKNGYVETISEREIEYYK